MTNMQLKLLPALLNQRSHYSDLDLLLPLEIQWKKWGYRNVFSCCVQSASDETLKRTACLRGGIPPMLKNSCMITLLWSKQSFRVELITVVLKGCRCSKRLISLKKVITSSCYEYASFLPISVFSGSFKVRDKYTGCYVELYRNVGDM